MHGSYAVYLIGPRVPLGCCACAGAFAVAAGSMVTSSSEVLAAAHKVEVDRKREAAIQEQLRTMTVQAQPKPTDLTPEAILQAWSMLSPGGHSVLTKSQVLDNLRIFFPNISAREVKDLVGTGNLSIDKLTNLLTLSDMPHVEANVEGFKILDTQGTSYLDPLIIKKLLLQMHGVDKVDDADMDLILTLCDPDKDGRISFKDFASIGSWAPVKETPTAATRKMMLEKLKESQGIMRND